MGKKIDHNNLRYLSQANVKIKEGCKKTPHPKTTSRQRMQDESKNNFKKNKLICKDFK